MICFDTNVLIWGVQGVARPSQTGMIDRTRRYLRQLSKDNEQVMVPAVVVGEYLMGFPSEERSLQIETLSRYFFLPAFDARCAALSAELADVGRPPGTEPGSRVVFRADIQIVATAIVNGAVRIVTSNFEEYRRIAGNRITVLEVPQVWEQGEMPLDNG